MRRFAPRKRSITVMAAFLVAAMVLAALLFDRPASATEFTTVIVTASDDDGIELDGQSYSDAVDALEDAGDSITVVVPSLPSLLSLNVTEAEMTKDDDGHALALRGDTTLLGVDAELLVNTNWEDGDSTEPKVALILRFESIALDTLNQEWDADEFPVELSPALVGLANDKHKVKGSEALDTNEFFDDGLDGTKKEFEIDASGVSLQAVVESELLSEAAEYLGAGEGIRVRGKLAASTAVLAGSSDSSDTTGLDLSADIALTTPDDAKEQGVDFDSPWTLNFKANEEGKYEASFKGAVKVDFDDGRDEPVKFTATVSIKREDNKTTLELKGEAGEVKELFGEEWLTLKEFKVTAKITKEERVKFETSMEGKLELGAITGKAKLKIEKNDDKTSVKLDLSATTSDPIKTVVEEFYVDSPAIPEELGDITISNINLHVAAEVGGSETKLTASLHGRASFPVDELCEPGDLTADLLVRVAFKGSETPGLIIGGALEGLTLKHIDCDMPFDWELPRTVLTFATSELEETDWEKVDKPTQKLFCPTGQDCPNKLSIPSGVQLRSNIQLDDDIKDALAELGVDVDGPLVLSGNVPMFGDDLGLNLKVALPTIHGEDDDLVEKGTVSLELSVETSEIKAKISGDLTFRITRMDQDNCGAGAYPEPAGEFSGGGCFDTLDLTVEGSIAAGTDGLSLTIAGEVSSWENAFGEPILTINTFRLELSIQAGGTAGVGLGIGFFGDLLIKEAGDPTGGFDIALAIDATITPNPPFITVSGLTFGTSRGIPLQDIVATFAPDDYEANELPDLSLKNIWFSYGTSDNEALCIRQGLYMSAELQLNDPDPGSSVGNNPVCPGEDNAAGDGDLDVTDIVSEDAERFCTPGETSCLAAIVLDVSSDGFLFYGALTGFEAGPIHSDGLELYIEINAERQQFYFKGGATLYDPADYFIEPVGTDTIWAGAYLHLDVGQAGGAFELILEACALVGGTTPAQEGCPSTDSVLLAHLEGDIFVDFNNPGGELFEDASATFSARFSSEALEELGEWLEEEFEEVAAFLDDAAEAIEGTAQEVIQDVENTFCQSFPLHCESLEVTAGAYDSAPQYVDAQIDATDREIRDSAAVNTHCFFDTLFVAGKNTYDCVQEFRDLAEGANNSFIANNGGPGYIALHGVDGTGFGGIVDEWFPDLYWVQPTTFNWPGDGETPLCAAGGDLEGNRICQAGIGQAPNYDELVADYLIEVLEQHDPAIAEMMRSGDFTVGATETQTATEIQAMEAQSDPGFDHSEFLDAIRKLGDKFDMDSPLGICEASATFEWLGDPAVGSSADFEMRLESYGAKSMTKLGIIQPDSPDGLPFDPEALNKDIIRDLLGTDIDDLECPTGFGDPTPGALSLELSSAAVDEGDTLKLTGTAPAGAEVFISWGDEGATSTVHADAAGAWSASRQYKDGPAFHVIKVEAAGEALSAAVTVRNVAPAFDELDIPGELDEGEGFTLEGTFSDPGVLDAHALTVDWGDGSDPVELAFAAGDDKEFALEHWYRDDGIHTVELRLTDKDRGRTTHRQDIVVHNVAPHDLKLLSATRKDDGSPVDLDPEDSHLMVEEGVTVIFTGTFVDPGVDDEHTVVVDFGDWPDSTDHGQSSPGLDGVAFGTTSREDPDDELVHFEVEYTFRDDMPTGEADALMDMQIVVDDGDGGVGEFDEQVRVLNVPPEVATNVDEQKVQYSDPIVEIVLTATDVVGYVDQETGEWSETLTASKRWQVDGGDDWTPGVPDGLVWSVGDCIALGEEDAVTGTFPPDTRQECTWTVSGIAGVAPGDYTIEFEVVDDDTGASTTKVEVEVLPEDAEARYVGPTVVSSPDLHDGEMEVELRAVVRDITAVDDSPHHDEYPGDIANATVSFVDEHGIEHCSTEDVAYVFESNELVGVAACDATVTLDDSQDMSAVTVRVEVGGWYTNELQDAEATVITVQRPNGSFVTGGGYFHTDPTEAPYSADSRTDVNLNVQWGNPRPGSLRGNARFRFEMDGRSYEIDATSYDSLGVLPGEGDIDGIAHVEARATLIDRSGRGRGTEVASDLRLQLRVIDIGSTANIGFALWGDDGALIIASAWEGDRFPEVPHGGGNSEVHIR